MVSNPLLFEPLKIRGISLPNRIVLSPLCMYSANGGVASDWQFAHLSTFARGGVGLVSLKLLLLNLVEELRLVAWVFGLMNKQVRSNLSQVLLVLWDRFQGYR